MAENEAITSIGAIFTFLVFIVWTKVSLSLPYRHQLWNLNRIV